MEEEPNTKTTFVELRDAILRAGNKHAMTWSTKAEMMVMLMSYGQLREVATHFVETDPGKGSLVDSICVVYRGIQTKKD